MRRLPPLNALRAFEAAARLGSATRAAAELCVTHSAVSKQIGVLEAWLQNSLFQRQGKRLLLTPAGRRLLLEAQSAFDRLAAVAADIAPQAGRRTLRLTAPPTFLMRWLVPRLSTFQRAHPDIEIQLSTRRETATPLPGGFDVAIRRSSEHDPGQLCVPFMPERVSPAAAPLLLGRSRRLAPERLAAMPWLIADMRPHDWPDWLAHAGRRDLQPRQALHFDHTYLAIEAALDGLGVVMAPLGLVQGELAAGQLLLPCPSIVLEQPGYFAVTPAAGRTAPAVAALLDWLRGEAAKPADAPLSARG